MEGGGGGAHEREETLSHIYIKECSKCVTLLINMYILIGRVRFKKKRRRRKKHKRSTSVYKQYVQIDIISF